jgi:murein DD-endopeptidase MepM/ murein hydrolase activator NlpD
MATKVNANHLQKLSATHTNVSASVKAKATKAQATTSKLKLDTSRNTAVKAVAARVQAVSQRVTAKSVTISARSTELAKRADYVREQAAKASGVKAPTNKVAMPATTASAAKMKTSATRLSILTKVKSTSVIIKRQPRRPTVLRPIPSPRSASSVTRTASVGGVAKATVATARGAIRLATVIRPVTVHSPISSSTKSLEQSTAHSTTPSPTPPKPVILQPPLNTVQFIVSPVVGPLNKKDKDPKEGDGRYATPRSGGIHKGIDINASSNTPILAPAAGKVVAVINRNVSSDPGAKRPIKGQDAGTVVVIDHGNGVTTHYFHLVFGSPKFRPGQEVKAGDVIANVGRTGNTPANGDTHLHIEVRLKGVAVDPLKHLPRAQ